VSTPLHGPEEQVDLLLMENSIGARKRRQGVLLGVNSDQVVQKTTFSAKPFKSVNTKHELKWTVE